MQNETKPAAMNPTLLQQARDALQAVSRYYSSAMVGMTPSYLPSVRAALASLDAHEAMSEYDKAIHDLAKYLPDGWYAQAPYSTETLLFYKEKPVMLTGTIETWEAIGKPIGIVGVPWQFTWRISPREIRSGRVVPQGGA